MSESASPVSPLARASLNDCWNKIGVWGNGSCPELAKCAHCRNCPVYSAAAVALLEAEPPAGYLDEWTSQFAQEKIVAAPDAHSVVIFRLGAEWLALPTAVFKEVAELRVIHTLPHRRGGAVLGLTNVRGELLVCVSLVEVLGLEKTAALPREKRPTERPRLVVISREGHRVGFPADEVHGIQHFPAHELQAVPATVARAAASYTRAILRWREQAVGCLDDQLLFSTLNRKLA